MAHSLAALWLSFAAPTLFSAVASLSLPCLASSLQQNRPYTALVVYENLHQSIKKPALVKIMDELSEEGVLQLKDFKKVRVYLAKQVRDEDNTLGGRWEEAARRPQRM